MQVHSLESDAMCTSLVGVTAATSGPLGASSSQHTPVTSSHAVNMGMCTR
jgi:hypothetical protein